MECPAPTHGAYPVKHDYPAVLRIAASHYHSLGCRQLDEAEAEKSRESHWIAERLLEAEALLTDHADVWERLRDIGRLIGCDHAEGPDGRLNLLRCVEQTLDGRGGR